MESEVILEELDNNVKEGVKMQTDSEHKFDELSRRLGVMEVRQLICGYALVFSQT